MATKPPKAAAAAPASVVEIPALSIRMLTIKLVGDSSLICHAWSHKAKQQILDKQMKRAQQAKAAKDPEQDYRDSLYPLPDGGFGFPAIAFKAAAVSACTHIAGITKVAMRGSFHIVGDMVRIDGTPEPREDMVRLAGPGGVADIRYRGEFPQWSATLTVRHNERVISAEQIVNAFNVAGFAVGVGEWRPEKDGSFGMFHVE